MTAEILFENPTVESVEVMLLADHEECRSRSGWMAMEFWNEGNFVNLIGYVLHTYSYVWMFLSSAECGNVQDGHMNRAGRGRVGARPISVKSSTQPDSKFKF